MKKILFLISGMFACILIFVMIIFIIMHPGMKSSTVNKLASKNFQNFQNIQSDTPTSVQPTESCAQFPLATGCGSVAGTPINICKNQYINYPPLSDILTTQANPNLGVY